MNADLVAIRHPRRISVQVFRTAALDQATAEIERLNQMLDVACKKLGDQIEENVKLNKMLDAACDELTERVKMQL